MTSNPELDLLAAFLSKGLHKVSVASILHYPYGRWTCADGRQVLFDRYYRPIWQRLPSGAVEPADSDEWVNYDHAEHFFDDQTPWHRQYQGMKRLRAVLVSWGYIQPNKQERNSRWREFVQRREASNA